MGGLVVGRQNADIADALQLRDVAMATNFGTQFAITAFVGFNFGCMIATDRQFDSRGRFSGSSYPMKT